MKASYYIISDSFPPWLPATHFASLHLTSTCFYPVSVSSKSASKDTRCHVLGKAHPLPISGDSTACPTVTAASTSHRICSSTFSLSLSFLFHAL